MRNAPTSVLFLDAEAEGQLVFVPVVALIMSPPGSTGHRMGPSGSTESQPSFQNSRPTQLSNASAISFWFSGRLAAESALHIPPATSDCEALIAGFICFIACLNCNCLPYKFCFLFQSIYLCWFLP